MTRFQSSRIDSDLLAYMGWQGQAYVLRKHGIERIQRNAKGQLAHTFAGAIAPPEVVAHWRRLGGVEVRKPRVLIACECSGAVRRAYRDRGIDAWSCDILPAEDGSPYHIQGDVLEIINQQWDMLLAFPPCTYTSIAGNRWFKTQPDRMDKAKAGFEFFMQMINAPIPKIAVENTRGLIWQWYRKPDQIIQPYQFGHPMTKATCLWLKGLPKLTPTNVVPVQYQNWTKYYGSHTGKARSKTFEGVAAGMADQWSPEAQILTFPKQLELFASAA